MTFVVEASPIRLDSRSTVVTPMTSSQELSYAVPALFASAAYCTPAQIASWSCGGNCNALPGVEIYGTGGNGADTQYWYVGYDPNHLGAIVVGHQGTDASKLKADLVDADFFLENLNPTLFPGVPASVRAHNGFLGTHSRSAPGVLAAVQAAIRATGSKTIHLVGHSLGGAIALLDAIYLPLHLPPDTVFHTNTFGMPRVGNQAFADYVDAHVTSLARITNKKDLAPIIPGRFLGFHHASGEKHIVTTGTASGDWYACEGQDNTSDDCATGAVPNILEGDISDHKGPYGAILIEC
ncbi:lipase [Cantharellus anzutake]|uniref:lipase n=1 Tax=Cantharellus anzutake TaxID=1750568 RepID=UPI0019050847|nr:lipase [Cantharellus anzutake]KAF8329761.1 lipase [Cantharellus anzutake]